MGQAVASSIGFIFILFLCVVPTRIYTVCSGLSMQQR